MSLSVADSLQGLLQQAHHALAQSKELLAVVQARVDSLLAVPPDTVVRVAQPELAKPVRVALDESFWSVFRDILTITLPVITFFVGARVSEDAQARRDVKLKEREEERDKTAKQARLHTAARLTRRYMLFGESVLKSMANSIENYKTLGPDKGGFFSAAYVVYAIDALSDFEEIKTRMVEFDNDDLEEAIWQWNKATIDQLRTLLDVMAMNDEQLKAKHGGWQNRKLMFESEHTMVLTQAQDAADIVRRIEPYLPPVKDATDAPAVPPGEAPR